jgi:hypothetical protein
MASPITWSSGSLVTELWIGAPSDPPLGTSTDYDRAATLVVASTILATTVTMAALFAMR